MSRSLSLAAYMAYARRGAPPSDEIDVERPEGELVWAHAGDRERAAALVQIAGRLAQLRPGLHMLLTVADGVTPPDTSGGETIVQPLPAEKTAAVTAFLDHWQPDLCLWIGSALRPALLVSADERGIPLFLIDATEAQFDRAGRRWLPDLTSALLKRFAQIQARSESAAQSLGRLGLPEEDIAVIGPLRSEAMPKPYDETVRDELAQHLLGRPVWLAAHLDPAELDMVLQARRMVSRRSYRLLLVIAPEQSETLAQVAQRLDEEGLRFADWSSGAWPADSSQVVLVAPEQDLGLWYRLAPVCLMGNSLLPGMTGRDPNEPAVHGSAILYGPNVRTYLKAYGRFAEARAARIVRDAETMAAAVGQLIAPDQAAAMAHAAWDVASQAAEVNDRLLDLIQDTLDLVGEP